MKRWKSILFLLLNVWCSYVYAHASYTYVAWNDVLNFEHASLSLLSQKIQQVKFFLNETLGNQRINVCIGQVSISGMVFSGSEKIEEYGRRKFYTSSSYDIREKVAQKLIEQKVRSAELVTLFQMLLKNDVKEGLDAFPETQAYWCNELERRFLEEHVRFDELPLNKETQTFNEDVLKNLYDYFLEPNTVIYNEMIQKFNSCKKAREIYLEKHAAFLESLNKISQVSALEILSPQLAKTKMKDISKYMKGYIDDIELKNSFMMSAFEAYKVQVGRLIKEFYHSEIRFLMDLAASELYQEMKMCTGDIIIRLHTYYDCCHRCKYFIANGFYTKMRQDFSLASSVIVVVSYNEPYECICTVASNINADLCRVCSNHLASDTALTDGVYFTRVVSEDVA